MLLAAYLALSVAVATGSPLERLDRWARGLPYDRSPGLFRVALDFVMLGQRAPASLGLGVWVAWLCLRRRTLDPAIRFALALILLNLTVGVVKVCVGRWGPFQTPDTHDVFAGGDIYPSGHASNVVVIFGLVAMLALRRRRLVAAAAAVVSVCVGLTTVYLGFHWVTDVVGGWLAGALVLLALPRCTAVAERAIEALGRRRGGRLARLPVRPVTAAPAPIGRRQTLEPSARA